MTRVAVVSDTHLPRFGRGLPRALVEGIRSAAIERILHLGDWTTELAWDLLAQLAPLDGVAGNNDPPSLVARLGLTKVIEIDGVRLGLTHGHLGQGRTTQERAAGAFVDVPDLAAVLFGHSHVPSVVAGSSDRPWLVNPGSPMDRRRQPRFTWAVLTIEGGALVTAALQAYDDRAA